MTIESGEFIKPEPEPDLDIPTIHELRRRFRGFILAREIEVRLLSEPSYTIAEPSTPQEEEDALRELEQFRQNLKDTKLRQDATFEALWGVSDLIDELENDAIKQADNRGESQ